MAWFMALVRLKLTRTSLIKFRDTCPKQDLRAAEGVFFGEGPSGERSVRQVINKGVHAYKNKLLCMSKHKNTLKAAKHQLSVNVPI
jgi:hypothetical protein